MPHQRNATAAVHEQDGLPPPHARDGAKGAVGPPTRKDVGAGVMGGACLGGSGEEDASVGVSDGVLLCSALFLFFVVLLRVSCGCIGFARVTVICVLLLPRSKAQLDLAANSINTDVCPAQTT